MFTKVMILAIPSVRMTIYRELRDLGQNNNHSERLQTEYRRIQNGGRLFEACRKSGMKMDFMKKLRVRGAATFQIRTPRV